LPIAGLVPLPAVFAPDDVALSSAAASATDASVDDGAEGSQGVEGMSLDVSGPTLVMVTAQGQIKRTPLTASYAKIGKAGTTVFKVGHAFLHRARASSPTAAAACMYAAYASQDVTAQGCAGQSCKACQFVHSAPR
jgi:hypothetical protein